MTVLRLAQKDDLEEILKLYTHLSKEKNPIPALDNLLLELYNRILNTPNYYLIIAESSGKIVASCTLIVIQNLTRMQKPYALVENVVTHNDYRRNGFGMAVLERAKEIAIEKNCYKIFLLTGSKEQNTLDFYKKSGYNSDDKTAFIQWL